MGKPMKTGWFGQTPYIPEKELDIYDVGTLPELVVTSAPNPTFTTKKIYNPNYSFNSENADISIIPATYINPRYDSTKRQLRVPYNQPTDTPNDDILEILANQIEPLQEKTVSYVFEPERSSKKVILETPSNDTKTFLEKRVPNTPEISIEELAKQVIKGKFGNGAARKVALGDNYAAVQALINKQLAGKRKTPKVNIPKIEQKYVTIEPGHEPPTEPIDIPQYFIDKHFELTNTPLTGAEIAAIRMDPFNLQTMPEEEIDMIIEESPEEKELARAERKEQRKENRAQRKEARKQRRLSRRSKNNKTE